MTEPNGVLFWVRVATDIAAIVLCATVITYLWVSGRNRQ